MTSELLPGLTLMVLLGLMSGRNTGNKLLACSWLSLKICVTTCPPPLPKLASLLSEFAPPTLEPARFICCTLPPCNLASASGKILKSPWASTTANPCKRMTAKNCCHAWAGVTGVSVLRLIVPLTRGSTTKLRRSKVASVRATDSISALTKLRVSGSAAASFLMGPAAWLGVAVKHKQAISSGVVSKQR